MNNYRSSWDSTICLTSRATVIRRQPFSARASSLFVLGDLHLLGQKAQAITSHKLSLNLNLPLIQVRIQTTLGLSRVSPIIGRFFSFRVGSSHGPICFRSAAYNLNGVQSYPSMNVIDTMKMSAIPDNSEINVRMLQTVRLLIYFESDSEIDRLKRV